MAKCPVCRTDHEWGPCPPVRDTAAEIAAECVKPLKHALDPLSPEAVREVARLACPQCACDKTADAVAVHLLKSLGCNRQPFSCTRPEAVERDDPLCRVCAALKEYEK